MFNRIVSVVLVAVLTLALGTLRAQDDDAEMQEVRQQIQGVVFQVIQKLNEQGISPQEFFGDIRQQMQEGSLDMEALQQKLVDKGLVEKETITKVQTLAQNGTLNSLKRQLDVTDAEWKVLLPKIQRVIAATGETGAAGQMGRMVMAFSGATKSDVLKRKQELRLALNNPDAKPTEFHAKLDALRDANEKAKEELRAAQQELTALLTVRQEAVLIMLGML